MQETQISCKECGMERDPVVAGQFYPGAAQALQSEVNKYLAKAQTPNGRALLAMAPHAGYVFSGPVAGLTLGQAGLSNTMLLLGPNHTGRGARFSLWNKGAWRIPGGSVPVEEYLAERLLQQDAHLEPDMNGHLHEHSLEVMLPFLVGIRPEARIVPIAILESELSTLIQVGRSIAKVLAEWPDPVSIVVSSDMSHYVPHEEAKKRDKMALDRIEAMDPEGLYETVRRHGITMCGVLPMTVGLAACRELGATKAEITAYDTSGRASGDYGQVVGYAGALVRA